MLKIVKAAFKTGSGTIIGLICGAIATKILAVMVGPSGMGIVSIIRQLHQSLQFVFGLNGQTAIVQGLVSRPAEQRSQYIATVLRLLGGWTLLFCAVIIAAAPVIGQLVFADKTTHSTLLIYAMVFPSVIAAGTAFLAGVINANHGIGVLAKGPIIAGVAWIALAYPVGLALNQGYTVAVVAIFTVTSGATFCYYLWYCHRSGWLKDTWTAVSTIFDKSSARQFLSFAASGLLTGFVGMMSILALRIIISNRLGMEAAAYFDTAWTLSMMYITILLSSFSSYYLPTLARCPDKQNISHLLSVIMRFGLAAGVPIIIAVIVLKPLVITILYSSHFFPALTMMNWMLIGDFFKIVTYVMLMTVLAFPNMRIYMLSEILWYFLFFLISYFGLIFTEKLHLIGVGFLVCYALAALGFFIYIRHIHKVTFPSRLIYQSGIGLLLIIFASIISWNTQYVRWEIAVPLVLSALVYSYCILTKKEQKSLKLAMKKLILKRQHTSIQS